MLASTRDRRFHCCRKMTTNPQQILKFPKTPIVNQHCFGDSSCDTPTTFPSGAYPQLPGDTHPAGCSHRTSCNTSTATGRPGDPTSSTVKAPTTASSCQPAKNRWGMPSTRATTLPHTGVMKTPRRAQCPWDTTVSPSQAYRATPTSNRQSGRPETRIAAFKQLRSRARNTRWRAPQ